MNGFLRIDVTQKSDVDVATEKDVMSEPDLAQCLYRSSRLAKEWTIGTYIHACFVIECTQCVANVSNVSWMNNKLSISTKI